MALDNTISAFNTYAATDEAIALSDTDFVAQAYASLLGLDGAFVNSEARIAFWVEKLEAGLYNGEELTRDNFAAAFLAAAASATGDEPTLTADDAAYNVAVTTYLSDNDAGVTSLDDVAALIAASGEVPPEEPADVTPLTEALNTLAAAQDAQTAFLDSAYDNELVAAEDGNGATAPDQATQNDEIDAAVITSMGVIDAFTGDDFTNATDISKAAIIADENATLDTAISDAQDDLDAALAAAAKVTGLVAAMNTKTSTAADVVSTGEAVAVADAQLAGAVTTFEALNAAVDSYTYLDAADGATGDPAAYATIEINDVNPAVIGTISLNADGQFEADALAADLPGIDAFIAAFQAQVDAYIAEDDAGTADAAADAALAAISGADFTDVLSADELTAIGSDGTPTGTEIYANIYGGGGFEEVLSAAQDDKAEFVSDVSDWEALVALQTEATALQTSLDDALAAIENAPDADPAGLGIDLVEWGTDFVADDEVTLYADNTTDTTTTAIAGFGATGVDSIYFGEGYTLVALGDGSITDNVGDSSSLEIFWQETGGALKLYVEEETFAGNTTTPAADNTDLTIINLTGGVAAEDITFADGYMTAGTVA